MSNLNVPSDRPLVEPLTARELEILSHMADHRSNREIADLLVLSLNTVKWYARQIYGKLEVNSRRQAVARAKELRLLENDTHDALPQHNLPAQLTPFVGRQEELRKIDELLSEPTSRLLALIGPGGMGKTRLAIQAASLLRETHPDSFRDGVFFVPLAALSDSDSIPAALGQAIGFSFYPGKGNPEQKLTQYLHQRRMLLVLDNFEHLIDGESVRLLTDILAAAPGVRMMITSRARLNARGEVLVSLGGMEFPEIASVARGQRPVDRAAAYSGIQLFLHSARRVRPDVQLDSDNLASIARICALVQGAPLGIELAAAWMTVLEPDEIAARIEQSLDFLKTDAIDVPARQRSLRAVADSSWSLLTEGERLAIQQLSVFRDGFDRAAAQDGGGVPLEFLVALVNKCWIQRETGGRYRIHELLRQYGAKRLACDPVLEAAAHDQHSRYYCDWLSRQAENINRAEHPPAWSLIQDDIENVRAACLWSATHGQPSCLAQAVDALGWFYYVSAQQQEITFRRLRETLTAAEGGPSSASAGALRTMARVLIWEATLGSWLGDLRTGKQLLGESLALVDSPTLAGEDTRLERAHIAMQSAYEWAYTDAQKSQQHLVESVELYEQIGHKLGMAYALLALGRAANLQGEIEQARKFITQSISLHRETGNQIGQSEAMAELGYVAALQVRFQEAEGLIRQSLSLAPETHRFRIASGLGLLGLVQLWTGRFVEAQASFSECIALYEDLGWRWGALKRSVRLVRALLHAGEASAARVQAERILSLARKMDWGLGVSYAKLLLGEVALVKGAFAQAYQVLQESRLGLLKFTDDAWDVDQSAWLGLAARGLERKPEARQHLASALDWASRHLQFTERMVALAGIALLLADEGEAERATELYALASRYPFVANSQWLEDIVGRQIAAVTASLPPHVAAAARERGQARDLDATVAELLIELGRDGSPA